MFGLISLGDLWFSNCTLSINHSLICSWTDVEHLAKLQLPVHGWMVTVLTSFHYTVGYRFDFLTASTILKLSELVMFGWLLGGVVIFFLLLKGCQMLQLLFQSLVLVYGQTFGYVCVSS